VNLNSRKAAMVLASKLYEQDELSLKQTAELAGFTKLTFAELLGVYNVFIFNFPLSE
jgi:predicted HTH domain antitoxin